jgi:hypothetical protein
MAGLLPQAPAFLKSPAPRIVRSMFAANPGRVVLLSADNCPAAQRTCGAPAAPICPAVYL